MNQSRALLVIIASLGLGLSAAVRADQPTTEPTAAELIELAPKVTLDDPHFKTLHLSLIIREGDKGGQRCELYYERPDRLSLLVTDLRDETPCVLAVNHRLLLYDPMHERVVSTSAPIGFEVYNEPGNVFRFKWGIASPSDDLVIDLKSMLSVTGNKVSRSKGETLTLSYVSPKGNVQTAYIDRSKRCPYTRIEVAGAAETDPFLKLVMTADEPTPAFAWRFPTAKSFNEKVTFVTLDQSQVEPAIPASSAFYRFALLDSAYREKWEKTSGQVDWQKARTFDAKASAALRQIISDLRSGPGN